MNGSMILKIVFLTDVDYLLFNLLDATNINIFTNWHCVGIYDCGVEETFNDMF